MGDRSLRLDDEIGSRRAKEEYLPSKDERLLCSRNGCKDRAWQRVPFSRLSAGVRRIDEAGGGLGAEAMARREARWREFEAAAAGDVRVGARGLTQTGEIQVRVRPEARRIFELRVFSSRFDEVY